MWYHLYVESTIQHKWTYLGNRNRLTVIENSCGCQVGEGVGEGGIENWGFADANYYRMDKQQGPSVEHRLLYSISCDKPK